MLIVTIIPDCMFFLINIKKIYINVDELLNKATTDNEEMTKG